MMVCCMEKKIFNAMLDDIEKVLLKHLSETPEMTITELSKKTGYDRKTLRARIKKLKYYGVLSGPKYEIEVANLGFNYASITIEDNPAHVSQVINFLETLPSVHMILYSFTGKIQVIVSYSRPEELDSFLNTLLENGSINYKVDDNIYIIKKARDFI